MAFKLPDFQYFRYEIMHRWERLATLRRWINRNPKIVIGVTLVSVLILLVIIVWLLLPEKGIESQQHKRDWFYDLNTGRLFVARAGQIPPIQAPSGPLPDGQPAGVKAYVFSYMDEPNEAERFIGFLETTDPNAKKETSAVVELKVGGVEGWGRGKLIRRLQDRQWVPANSVKGRAILKLLFAPNKKGQHPRYYPPD